MESNLEWSILTLSTTGALTTLLETEELGGRKLVTNKTEAYICRYCLRVLRDSQKAREHVDRMHTGPVSVPRCAISQEDMPMDVLEK